MRTFSHYYENFSRHGENNPCPECIVTGVLEVNCEPAFRVSRVDV